MIVGTSIGVGIFIAWIWEGVTWTWHRQSAQRAEDKVQASEELTEARRQRWEKWARENRNARPTEEYWM